jgi:hypothetical protein
LVNGRTATVTDGDGVPPKAPAYNPNDREHDANALPSVEAKPPHCVPQSDVRCQCHTKLRFPRLFDPYFGSAHVISKTHLTALKDTVSVFSPKPAPVLARRAAGPDLPIVRMAMDNSPPGESGDESAGICLGHSSGVLAVRVHDYAARDPRVGHWSER